MARPSTLASLTSAGEAVTLRLFADDSPSGSCSLTGFWVVHLHTYHTYFILRSTGIYFCMYIEEVTAGGAGFCWASLPEDALTRDRLVGQMTAPATTVLFRATSDTQLRFSASSTARSRSPSLSAVTPLLTLMTYLEVGTRPSSPAGLSSWAPCLSQPGFDVSLYEATE